MFNEVNELLNENKIKMMTKMAIYEKNEGKSMLKTAKYFKGDYIAFGVLKTVIATTFAGVILLAMYFLCNAEGMIRDINNLDYIGLAKKFALYYVLMLIVFCVIAGFVYYFRYENTRKGIKRYFSRLNKLERFYTGQKKKLKNPVFALLLSVICAFLPGGFTLIVLSAFILIQLYVIAPEFALLVLCVMLLMYLLYFRFAPKTAYILIITAMFCWMKIPFVLPVAIGLCSSVAAVIPVSFGVIMYYIIRTASDYEAAISDDSLSESMKQISYLIESLLKNRQMLVLIIAAAVTIIVVYIIRRQKIDHSWKIAIIVGSITQFLILVVGQIALKSDFNIVLIIIGTILGVAAAYICNIVFFALDYKRTEYVQYEDDEYYYYVKAVPKINVANADVRIKHINAKKTKKTDDIRQMRTGDTAKDNGYAVSNEEDDDILFYDDDK